MIEAVTATLIFWSAFHFSLGPWWLAFMEAAKHTPTKKLLRDFAIYLCTGWIPFVILSSALLQVVGGLHKWLLIALHFGRAALMFYLAYKTLQATIGKGKARQGNGL